MRLFLAALLAVTTNLSTAHAGTQQQCETLAKPVEAKMESAPDLEESKPTPQNCARAAALIELYTSYQSQADGMNCPFAYVEGQEIGGAEERAELLAGIKQAYTEKCQ